MWIRILSFIIEKVLSVMTTATEPVVTDILNCSVRAETPETIVIDVLNCCKWIRILNFTEIVMSGMIAAIESVVTDILNCLGIAETTETVVIDVLQCWMRRRYSIYIYKLYRKSALWGLRTQSS
jgi:hypothetical protein